MEQAELFEGERFTIEGQIRSFNNREPTGRRLILCVYALSMMTTDAPMQNEAVLTGTVCKPPVYRQTPWPADYRSVSGRAAPVPQDGLHPLYFMGPDGAGRRRIPDRHGADAHGQAPEPDISQKLGRDERDAHRV